MDTYEESQRFMQEMLKKGIHPLPDEVHIGNLDAFDVQRVDPDKPLRWVTVADATPPSDMH